MIFRSHIVSIIISAGLIFSLIPTSYAQSIPITISPDMDHVIFDGKWTFLQEWKPSSLNEIDTPSGSLYIRTAHYDNFIYVFIDAALDTKPVAEADRATICLDADNSKSKVADSDDYCFIASLDSKSSFALQGGSPLEITDNFKRIPISPGFIGIGGISDSNDIYAQVSHPSFEFKIPTDLVGRSDSYGFFVEFYDGNTNKFYSWPQTSDGEFYSHIPSPSKWGELVSPDHTLPEFPLPSISLISSFLVLIYLLRYRMKN